MSRQQTAIFCWLVLMGWCFGSCQPDQRKPVKDWPVRTWGVTRTALGIPDTAIYHLATYLVSHPVIKWERGDSLAPFTFGRVLYDCLGMQPYTGPYLQPSELEALLRQGILTADDVAFYRTQMRTTRNFRLEAAKLPACTIVPLDSILAILMKARREGTHAEYKQIKSRYGSDIYGMSTPLFSRNYRVATVEVKHWCGFLCAEYYTIVLRRHGQQWRLVKILSEGFS